MSKGSGTVTAPMITPRLAKVSPKEAIEKPLMKIILALITHGHCTMAKDSGTIACTVKLHEGFRSLTFASLPQLDMILYPPREY